MSDTNRKEPIGKIKSEEKTERHFYGFLHGKKVIVGNNSGGVDLDYNLNPFLPGEKVIEKPVEGNNKYDLSEEGNLGPEGVFDVTGLNLPSATIDAQVNVYISEEAAKVILAYDRFGERLLSHRKLGNFVESFYEKLEAKNDISDLISKVSVDSISGLVHRGVLEYNIMAKESMDEAALYLDSMDNDILDEALPKRLNFFLGTVGDISEDSAYQRTIDEMLPGMVVPISMIQDLKAFNNSVESVSGDYIAETTGGDNQIIDPVSPEGQTLMKTDVYTKMSLRNN